MRRVFLRKVTFFSTAAMQGMQRWLLLAALFSLLARDEAWTPPWMMGLRLVQAGPPRGRNACGERVGLSLATARIPGLEPPLFGGLCLAGGETFRQRTLPAVSAIAMAEKSGADQGRKRAFGPRVPKAHSETMKAIQESVEQGKAVNASQFDSLLAHLAGSARRGSAWADSKQVEEVLNLMEAAKAPMNTEAYRNAIIIASEDSWRGEYDLGLVFQICDKARKDPHVQVDADMYNLLLEATAGLSFHGMAQLEDGEKLFGFCVEDGLEPDLVTWAGLLDIIVGCARCGVASYVETKRILAGMEASKVTNRRNFQKWEAEVMDIVGKTLPEDEIGLFANSWSEFRRQMKGQGLSLRELGDRWFSVKERRGLIGSAHLATRSDSLDTVTSEESDD